MFKAIIFDMNGVIINDEELHAMAFSRVLSQFGVMLSREDKDYKEICLGRTDREGFEVLIERFGITEDINELLRQKAEEYLKLVKGNIKSYPGVLELVHKLKDDFMLALVTGAIRQEAELTLKYFKIKDCFKVTITGDDTINGKPDPEPYIRAVEYLHISPDDCVIIEDSSIGVESAKRAGIECIAVLTTHQKEDLTKADFIAKDFKEVEEYIYKN